MVSPSMVASEHQDLFCQVNSSISASPCKRSSTAEDWCTIGRRLSSVISELLEDPDIIDGKMMQMETMIKETSVLMKDTELIKSKENVTDVPGEYSTSEGTDSDGELSVTDTSDGEYGDDESNSEVRIQPWKRTRKKSSANKSVVRREICAIERADPATSLQNWKCVNQRLAHAIAAAIEEVRDGDESED
jgi:hypothetical protein